jgi:hypothetical protein
MNIDERLASLRADHDACAARAQTARNQMLEAQNEMFVISAHIQGIEEGREDGRPDAKFQQALLVCRYRFAAHEIPEPPELSDALGGWL